MKKNILLLAAIMFGSQLQAQEEAQHKCGMDEYVDEIIAQNPELEQTFEAKKQAFFEMANEKAKEKKKANAAVYTIPVVFHIIYNTQDDNIKRNQIEDALRILNEDFRKQNADAGNLRPIFQSRQADTEIEFALAKKDPDGNCTEGITRMQSSLSVDADPRDRVKSLVQWDPDKYLNIWVVRSIISESGSGTILGYANFPWMSASTDGIVIRHDALGLVGTAAYDGRTLTHEIGHYLGLLHTFQSGCSGGDNIADTPPVASASYGCNLNKNSCSNDSPDYPDMIENFMDYSDGACQNTYTTLQKNAMRSVLAASQYRQELVSQSNLEATGVVNPPACQPVALFDVATSFICENESVSFIDQTEDGDPDTYQWYFQGGVPSTSGDRNPTVSYPTPGAYDVTLTVSNAAGTSTITKTGVVAVKTSNSYNNEWSESFENPEVPTPSVTLISDDVISFELSDQGASSGNQSLFINNFLNNNAGSIDEVISPNIQTLFGKNLSMTFDHAFARKEGDNSDILLIQVSTDCGASWSTIRALGGANLTTAPNLPAAEFIPTSAQWKTTTVPLSSYESIGPILIKFQFRSGGGNNFYLDNINISADNIGLEENLLKQSISVYPNPSSGSVHIDITDYEKEVSLSIHDMYGKQYFKQSIEENHLTLDNLNLSSGVYILNFTSQGATTSKKLIIE